MHKEVSMNNDISAVHLTRTRSKWVRVLGALAVAAAALLVWAFSTKGNPDATAAVISKPSVPASTVVLSPEQRANVLTEIVKPADLPVRVAVPARVEFNANRVTPLFAQFAGRVVRLDVEVGMSVREGQILGMLDSPEIVGIQSDYQRACADLQQALAAERTARTALGLAARTRERAARLVSVEAIPLREAQEAEAAEAHATEELQRARAAVVAAESAVAAARARLRIAGLGDQDIERLDKGGSSAIARLTPLVAPVGGTVVDRNVGLGQMVQAGGEPLLKIADLSSVWVNAEVYEDQLASIRPGAEVTIRTPAYPNETFAARVDRIAPIFDAEKRTVSVRCVVPNGNGRLKPGMFATVVLQSGTIQRALVVPEAAVVAAGNRRTAFVETELGTYRETAIETGDEIFGSVVVKSGLQEGDRVVVQGSLLLSRQLAEARSGQ
jgi:cobalt-zinc-cadmium efflux system membrane fusion protein